MRQVLALFNRLGFWGFVLTFTVIAIIVSELLIIIQSYFLSGSFFTEDFLIIGFITPAIDGFILFFFAGLILQALKEQNQQNKHYLAESEQLKSRLQQYLDIADVVLVALDREGKITLTNRTTNSLLGVSHSNELIGKDWFELLIDETEYERVYRAFQEIINGNLAPYHEFTNKIHLKDGSVRLINWTNDYIFDDDGNITGVLSSGNDITKQKQAQNQITEQSELLRTVIDEIPDPVVLKNWEGKFLLANKACAELYSTTPEEMIGKDDGDFIPDKELAEFFRENVQNIMRQGKTEIVFEDSVDVDTGEYRHYRSIKKPFYNSLHEPQILVLAQDITVLKNIENQLREKESYQRALLDSAPFMIWLKDKDSRFLAANQRLLDATDCTSMNDVIGKNDYELWDYQLAKGHIEADLKVLESLQPIDMEEPFIQTDGSYGWLETYKAPVLDDDGELQGTVGFARNITQHKKELKELYMMQYALSNIEDAYYLIDRNANFITVNQAASNELGYSIEELQSMGISDIDHHYPMENWDEVWQMMKQKSSIRFESVHTRKDGTDLTVEIISSFIEYEAEQYVLSIVRNITKAKESARLLKTERDRFSLAIEGSQDGLWDWNLETNETFFSARYLEILKYSETDTYISSPNWEELVHPDDVTQCKSNAEQHLQGNSEVFENQHRMLCKDGSWKWVLSRGKALFDENQQPIRFVGFITDISAEIEYKEKLEYIAKHDPLTDLPNRFMLNELLQSLMSRSERNHSLLAVLYIDLDGFKEVNDKYGHDTGDIVLGIIANRMKQTMRLEDLASRIGGDEFVVVLPDIDNEQQTLPLIQRLIDEISTPIFVNDVNNANLQITTTASVGVSIYPQNEVIGSDALLRQADQAMYQAKTAGKNSYNFFNIVENQTIKKKQQLISKVETAINNNEMRLHYQPKVELNSGEVYGFEALLRWQDGESLIYPDQFLPMINVNASVMKQLGEWVFGEAFSQLSAWNKQGHKLTLSINISAHELHSDSSYKLLEHLLTIYSDLSANQIELEILESNALEDTDNAMKMIKKYQSLGINVSLDDFGTGYSSLTNLKNLPVDTLKIDRSFVMDMLQNKASFSIIEAAIGLARAFGCSTVAEGVETEEQADSLQKLGCENIQGYLVAKPMPANKVEEWLVSRQANK